MASDKICIIALVLLLCVVGIKNVIGEDLSWKSPVSGVDIDRSLNGGLLQAEIVPKACDCGPNSVSCTFVNYEKICTCEYNYVPSANGTCIEPCNCENFGNCKNNVCECRYGTYGPHCQFIKGCEGDGLADACGDPLEVECGFNANRGELMCLCKDSSFRYDKDSRTCGECECGPNGRCNFEKGKKKCDCDRDFVVADKGAEREGQCRRCACGENSDGCMFNSSGKICKCKEGFAQRVSQCKECKCGPHAICSFNGYDKVCTCEKGYKMENGECKTCDCGPHGTCLYNEKYEKVCNCSKDAILYKDTCVECNCGLDGSCLLIEGKKACTCDKGFGDREGYCIACQCYYENETMPCTFHKKIQKCYCPKGYKEFDFVCKKWVDPCLKANCPATTRCEHIDDGYECACLDGYQPFGDGKDTKTYGCEAFNVCDDPETCPHTDSTQCISSISIEGYECVCKKGYVRKSGNHTTEESPCERETPRKSDTVYIVVGVLVGLVVVAVPVGYFIYRRRSRY